MVIEDFVFVGLDTLILGGVSMKKEVCIRRPIPEVYKSERKKKMNYSAT